MKLSFCMIVRDEEERLARCLESVRSIADELIVLDTGSRDRTIEIAKSFGATVRSFEWCDDFSAARNAAMQYVQGEWVLILDADEVLSQAIVAPLKEAIESEQRLVINLIRQEIGAMQSPYSMVSRLFRNHPAVQFRRPYHAMIDDSVDELLQKESHWQIGYLPDVAIFHEGYRDELITSRNKAEKARKTMEGFLEKHPSDPYVCSKLGALYVQMGEMQTGLELLRRGLRSIHSNTNQNAAKQDSATLYELHYHLGSVYSELHNLNQAEQHYQTALQQPIPAPLKLGAINNLGNILKDKGDVQNAIALYHQALQIDPYFAIAHHNLGITLRSIGQLADAIEHYNRAIALHPTYAEAYQNLGVALLTSGQVIDSLDAFRSAIGLYKQQGSPEAQRLRQALSDMGLSV